MTYTLLYHILPDLAERETRCVAFLDPDPGEPPPGTYAFMEMFCAEPDCDCRNAIISVGRVDEQGATAVAQLRFCWEDEQYYQSIDFDFDMIPSLPGVGSDIMSPSSPYLPNFISCFEMLCQENGQPFSSSYVTRIKDHYRLFKEEIKRRPIVSPPLRAKNTTPRNAPCPCGSGRKHKKCCLK